jgi:hypothetical protein
MRFDVVKKTAIVFLFLWSAPEVKRTLNLELNIDFWSLPAIILEGSVITVLEVAGPSTLRGWSRLPWPWQITPTGLVELFGLRT